MVLDHDAPHLRGRACKDCKCSVSAEKAVTKDGAMFCCEECASGHAHHPGCKHDGCNCGG